MRFPRFSDPWKKFALGDIGTSLIGLTYSPNDVVQENGIIVLRSSNIQEGALDFNDVVRVSKKIRPSLFTQEEDILICSRNGSARLIGKNAIIPKSYSGLTFGAFMMVYRSNQNRFIHHLLNTKRYQTQVSENLGARINQITSSDLNSFEFFFPCEKEQNKIAKFIDLIDERIATQRRLIEDLEKLKSSIIDRCYRGNNNLRLGEFISQVSQRNRANHPYKVMSVSNVRGFVPQSEQFSDREIASENTTSYKIVTKEIFAYNPARINIGSIARFNGSDKGIVSPMYICFKVEGELQPKYLEYFFQTRRFKNDVELRLEGSVRLCLNFDALCEIEIPILSPAEQITISSAIETLCNKIVLERKVLSNMDNQRKYLLSNLFM